MQMSKAENESEIILNAGPSEKQPEIAEDNNAIGKDSYNVIYFRICRSSNTGENKPLHH